MSDVHFFVWAIKTTNNKGRKKSETKGAFTHPVSACLYRFALQYFITYHD